MSALGHRKSKKVRTLLVQTKYGAHLCDFITDPDGKGYTVIAKHLPGVVTQGQTLQEAKAMAKEALELGIECSVGEKLSSLGSRRVAARRALALHL